MAGDVSDVTDGGVGADEARGAFRFLWGAKSGWRGRGGGKGAATTGIATGTGSTVVVVVTSHRGWRRGCLATCTAGEEEEEGSGFTSR